MDADTVDPDESQDQDVITKDSPWSVADTVRLLSGLVAAKGMKLFAVIDHSGEAQPTGWSSGTPRSSSSGAPRRGRRSWLAAPLAALDLPLKVLVWADGSRTKVSYTAPGTLPLATASVKNWRPDLPASTL